ncbi:MAG: hypothetical protein ACRCU5_00605 [Rhizobiaceae bacterium]
MPWEAFDFEAKVIVKDGQRFVMIPETVVLVGEDILIRQEKNGVISIHPTTKEGREALSPFNPFWDFVDDEGDTEQEGAS